VGTTAAAACCFRRRSDGSSGALPLLQDNYLFYLLLYHCNFPHNTPFRHFSIAWFFARGIYHCAAPALRSAGGVRPLRAGWSRLLRRRDATMATHAALYRLAGMLRAWTRVFFLLHWVGSDEGRHALSVRALFCIVFLPLTKRS